MDVEKRRGSAVPEEEKIDFSTLIDDMWKGLLRYWWCFLAVVSVCASLMYFYARWTYEPYYTAYSTFTVKTVESVGYSSSDYNQTVAKQLGEVFPYILTSDVLKRKVADDIGMSSVPGTVRATALSGTNLITLSVDASNGQLAYDILQAVIRNYPSVSEYVIGNVELGPMDESGVPISPANAPNFRRRAELGALIGAAGCVVFLILYALTRMTIRSEEDLRKVFNISCLGVIPLARLKKRSGKAKSGLTVDSSGIPYIFIESVRTVRNRLERLAKEHKVKSILVTSALAKEGKSTVAANLALSLAHKERKVVLVDLDLRNPSSLEALGIEGREKGIHDFLKGEAALEEIAVQHPKLMNFRIIPGLHAQSDPADLLSSPELKKLLRGLRKQADYVIVDTPPCAVVSDAATIAQYVDGGVYVVLQDYAKVDVLQEGMEMFSGTGIRMLGCVLNATTAGITGSGYGYGRYGYGKYGAYGKYGSHYGYGYGYGYGEKPSEEQKQ